MSGCQIVDQLVNKNKQINALKALDNNKLLPPPCNGPAKITSLEEDHETVVKVSLSLVLYANTVTFIVGDSVKVESSLTSRNPLALRSSYHGDLEPWLDLYSIVCQTS